MHQENVMEENNRLTLKRYIMCGMSSRPKMGKIRNHETMSYGQVKKNIAGSFNPGGFDQSQVTKLVQDP